MAQKCQVKKGFFTLRECESKAFVNCSVCGRPVCAEHSSKEVASRIICLECYAREHSAAHPSGKKSDSYSHSAFDSLWYYTSRTTYYNNYHYVPFTAQDRESFEYSAGDNLPGDGTDFNDHDEMSLMDS